MVGFEWLWVREDLIIASEGKCSPLPTTQFMFRPSQRGLPCHLKSFWVREGGHLIGAVVWANPVVRLDGRSPRVLRGMVVLIGVKGEKEQLSKEL